MLPGFIIDEIRRREERRRRDAFQQPVVELELPVPQPPPTPPAEGGPVVIEL